MFGINDDGSICGIENAEQICLDIENRINDNITPKPDFELKIDKTNLTFERKIIELISQNTIRIVLPIISTKYNVTGDEEKIIKILENENQLSSSEIAKALGYTKSKTLRIIERLKEKSYIKVIGCGRGTKYHL